MRKDKEPIARIHDPHPEQLDQIRALRRVRAIAAASAALGSLKLLPGIDALVVAVEWFGLKTALPALLELWDSAREGRLAPRALLHGVWRGSWFSLLHRAFGASGGGSAATLDLLSDAENALLPAPFDGFDLPAPAIDLTIAFWAHRRLRALGRAPGSELRGPARASAAPPTLPRLLGQPR